VEVVCGSENGVGTAGEGPHNVEYLGKSPAESVEVGISNVKGEPDNVIGLGDFLTLGECVDEDVLLKARKLTSIVQAHIG
jgi:hypothetical protein